MASSSRRDFLRIGVAGAAAGLAGACAGARAASTGPGASLSESKSIGTAGAAGPSATTEALHPGTETAGAPATAPAAPAAASGTTGTPATPAPTAQRTLVVVQLSGGNDGLNAVVPYGNGMYYQLRPQIGIAANQVLALDNQIGLHPNLKSFKALYDQHRLAIIHGPAYPNPPRSTFLPT